MRRPSLRPRHLFGLFLLIHLVSAGSLAADPITQPYVPDEVIVRFKNTASEQDKDHIRAELGGPKIKGLGRIQAELRRLENLTVEEAVAQYRNHPKIEYIEPNYVLEANEIPNDPRFSELYAMLNTGQTGGTPGADIRATTAWDVFTGSGQVVVGVIDTGVDYTHPDLAANIYTNPGEVAGNGVDDDLNGYVDDVSGWDFYNNDNDAMDDHGHGSHVSGTIGATGNNGIGVAGVCWNVKIVPLKFLSSAGSGSTADAVEAVIYATALGVRLTSNSWGGGGFSQALFDAIQAANTQGILFVAAAGNSGVNTDTSPHYPSSYNLPNIVAVAATDHNDNLASFSNYGATTVDLAAPGVNILSTFPGNSYGSISGTSMATPHVSGTLALVFGRFPSIGHLDAKNLILNFADPVASLSGKVLTGGRLNAFLPIADPDSIAPGPIGDVAVTETGSNWLIAGWTATGDDGATGTASRYVVKYSTAPIDASNFELAATAENPPDPGPPGTAETMRIDGLGFSTPYYVAVKALDEFGNASAISNVASGVTLGAPDIAASPLSFTETLLSGATSTQTLTLSNVGQGTLDFDIPPPELVTTAPLVAEYVEYGKDVVDPRPGVLGSGGPDSFGYRWVDSDDPAGPAFSWTDISGTGTLAISSGDDVNNGPHAIGFGFPFYGVEYTSFRICSNGWLSFNSTATSYSNQPLPNSGAPTALVAPFWDDLTLTASGDVYFQSEPTRLIVQWHNVPHYSSGGPYTFQAVLHADGTIEYNYLTMGSPTNSATIGIQNASRTDGLQVVYNAAYVHDNLSVRIAAVPQWVLVTPTSGTIYAPNSTGLQVAFEASGLLGGTYDANIRVFSNDPDESPYVIPVQMTVIGAPDIAVAPAAVDFGNVFLGATPVDIVQVQNPGTDVLHVSSATVDGSAYTLSQSMFDVPPRSSVNLEVTFAPTAVAGYPATLTLASDDPDEPVVTVSLSGQGVEPPAFAVTPTSLTASLYTGEAETQHLTLSNSGGADLAWSASVQFLASSQLYTLTAPEQPVGPDADGGSFEEPFRTSAIQVELNDLTGVDILWDRSNGQTTTTSWTTIIADLTARGATVTQSTAPITPELLAGYDILWCIDTGSTHTFDAAELAALTNWVNAGGGVLLEGDNDSSVNMYNALLTALGAGIEVSLTNGASGTTSNIHPHATTQNVTSIYLTANTASIGALTGLAGPLVDDVTGLTNTAHSRAGGGRIVVTADETFQNGRMSQANNQLFGNQVFDWLAGANFLTISPTSGTVPPGGSPDLDVLFDATGLFGGAYEANIVIQTNDPLALEATIPVDLLVTGAPDLVLSPTSIDFGQVYVGYPDLNEFEIFNAGTDQLTISNITSDNPAFSVFLGGGGFPIQLAPLTTTVLQARFAPPAPTAQGGTLTIHSNDQDSPQTLLAVSGAGLLPPLAGVSPTSLHADLLTGQIETQQFTVSNTGNSNLVWSAQLAFQISSQLYTLTAPEVPAGPDEDGGEVGPELRTTPISAQLADLTGVDILWDRSNGQATTSLWTTLIADLTARGATVTMSTEPLTPSLLLPYDVLWLIDTGSTATWDSAELTAVVNWVNGGGGVLLEGDNTATVNWYNELLTALGAGIEFLQADGASGTTTNIHPHTTTQDVTSIYLTANTASIGPVTGPAGRLVDDLNGVTNTAFSQVGAGRILATADETFQNARMSQASNQLFGNQGFDWLATPIFLSVDPDAGTLPPAGSTVVNATFDSGGLFGGDYAATIRVLSNDPAHGELDVAATLHVTGVPRISFEPASLDFGEVYVAYPESLTLAVTNIGTDLLSVPSVTAGLPDYSVDTPSFTLNPFEKRELRVILNPQATGDRTSTLVFQSNDPTAPHSVPLAGTGLLPPLASVNPDSLHADLLTGEIETHEFTLANTGDSDLEWSTQLQFQAATQLYTLTAPEVPVGPDEDGGQVGPDLRTTPISVQLADLTGVDILWDRSNGQGTNTSWSTLIADLAARGATVTSSTDPLTPALLADYDILWFIDTGSTASWDPAELAAVVDWVNAGGGVLLEGDNTATVNWYNELLAALVSGIVFLQADGADGTTSYIYPHATTADVTSIYLTANTASIAPPSAPAGRLVDDLDGVTNSAHSQVGGGRIVAIADETFQNTRMSQASNQLFGNQVFDWLATPAFLSVAPETGSVPPGGSTVVGVTFDATGLFGGDYAAQVRVLSNDPAHPQLSVAATLHVTGVPRISLEPASLDFGNVYIGYPDSLLLTVQNVGTEVLSVTSITAGLPDYTVDPSSFDLDPFESRTLLVHFDPQTDGDRSTTLVFQSNDPDSPHSVALAGVGVIPPVIGAAPDTVVGAAMPGGTKTKTLTVCNTGGSDLLFQVAANEQVSQVTVHEYLALPDQEDVPGSPETVDPRPGILGTGGPDLFGYTWIDSDEPGGPVYDWTDISAVGTPVGFASYSDNANVGPIPLGFDFPFYGNTFSELRVSTNGWVSFTNSALTANTNQPLPNSGASVPENLLAVWWDDMVYDESDNNQVVYHNDGTRFILQYDIRRIAGFTPPFYKYQIILYPNGNIVYQYHTLGVTLNTTTIGIQNGTKDDGLTVVFNDGTYAHEQLAILFTAGPDWLSVTPESGVVPAGECVDLQVTMDAAELEPGDYTGTVTLTSNDPATPILMRPVVLHVGTVAATDFDADPSTLNLGSNGKWFTGYVELPPEYAPQDVVVETVRLNGTVPADPGHLAIGDFNENGIPDLAVRFDRAAVQAVLGEGDSVLVAVTGEIEDTIWFTAGQYIRVIRPQLDHPNGGEVLTAGGSTEIRWTNPHGWPVQSTTLAWSGDGGENWSLIAEGITGQSYVWQVPAQQTTTALVRVYLLDAQGVMGEDTSDEVFTVGAPTDAEADLPTEYAVRPLGANPAVHGHAMIELALPQGVPVDVRIYDVRGALVRELVANRAMPAGRHLIRWDRTNRSGAAVGSGLYFVMARAGNRELRSRITVLR